MNKPELIAKAEELNRRARELWRHSCALTVAEYEALGADPSRIGPDDVCAAGAPLRVEAAALRAQAKQLFDEASSRLPAPIASFAPSPAVAPVSPAVEAIVARVLVAPGPTAQPPFQTGYVMPEKPSSTRYSKAELDAAVAAATANFRPSPAMAAAPVETAEQIAVRKIEARELEIDEKVSAILGDAGFVERNASARRARAAEEAAEATKRQVDAQAAAEREAEVAAVVARILSA